VSSEGPICRECGDDLGPYNGLCVDCLSFVEDDRARTIQQWHDQSRQALVKLLAALTWEADCTRRRVGAVLLRGTEVLGTGANALPSGSGSCLAGACPRGRQSYEEVPASSSYAGNCEAIHAEVRALMDALSHKHGVTGAVMYVTDEPCPGCQQRMRDQGVTWKVVTMEAGSTERAPAAAH
jgi:dCMP deaminase